MSDKRLLVIDDELGFREFVSNVATAAGYVVETAGHAKGFMEIYPAFNPTLILMDMILPDIASFELMQWLIEQGCTARVIVVTGYNPHYAEMAETIGTDSGMLGVETLTKPVGLMELRAALNPSEED
jgi:DNA-binding response OmpR family regulator